MLDLLMVTKYGKNKDNSNIIIRNFKKRFVGQCECSENNAGIL
jgi:hypothetical protein